MEIKDYFLKRLFYTDFQLDKRDPFSSYVFERESILGKLSTVNIFVGANNSGKSRFLRELFCMPQFQYKTNFFDGNEFRKHVVEFKPHFNDDSQNGKLWGCKHFEFDPTLLAHPEKITKEFFESNVYFSDQLRRLIEQTGEFTRENIGVVGWDYSNIRWLESLSSNFFAEWRTAIANATTRDSSFRPGIGLEQRFYIPILRGMRAFTDSLQNEYEARTRRDYFSKNGKIGSDTMPSVIFTGLELYTDLKKKLLGEPDERELIRDFEAFLESQFFDGKSVTLIPKEGQDVVHVKIGNERQLPIYQLGDGLQNLIIITYQMFTQKQRCLFFIEEPDLSMHPGMQRALLEVMTQHDQHQYFLTTHSNHLLDMASEFKAMSIYLFTKEVKDSQARFDVKQASSPDVNILKELGVHNSSVFLTNATVWVEGMTDRLYLRAYLKKYNESTDVEGSRKFFREDYHYSFVEYQGSNLTHWTFDKKDQTQKIKATYLCGHSFLIADGDVSNKGSRRENYTAMLGDRFHVLPCKEIENLIPVEILREIVKEEFVGAGKDVGMINYSKYSTSEKGLGAYLDKLLGKDVFGAESGTIKGKVNFCEKAIEIMGRTDLKWELTEPLKELCNKVYQFIEAKNK